MDSQLGHQSAQKRAHHPQDTSGETSRSDDTSIKNPDAREAPGFLRGKREDTSSPRASLVTIDSPRASSVTYVTPTEADASVMVAVFLRKSG
jgi:hypothetical protein